MKVDITVPRMGESISEAVVGKIIKSTGTLVKADDEVLELETDKVNQVVYAPKKGRITITVKEGDHVSIGAVLGYVETEVTAESAAPSTPAQPTATEKVEKKEETPKPFVPPQVRPIQQKAAPTPPVEESKVEQKTDIQEKPATSSTKETRRKMPAIRQLIAQRLVAAQHQAAMLTTFNEVDMTEVLELRQQFQETFTKQHQVKLGLMSFFVKAAVSALQAYPLLNSYIDGDEIVEKHTYDLGVAVSTDRGLMVPVIRDCAELSMADIEKALENYAKSAREGKISVDHLSGGSFTLTNGGVFGSLLSTPLINPPQSAILGMHKIQKRAVVIDDQIVIRPMMYLALSYDHRLIDGKEAVSFLVHIKNMVENPSRLLLDI